MAVVMISATASPVLVFVALLAGSIWVGGFVAIAVVSRIARSQLDPFVRVAFFRSLGRNYGIVAGTALTVALTLGAVLLVDHAWNDTVLAAIVVAMALVLATAGGVRQARGMTRLRQQALDDPRNPPLHAQLRSGARRAAILRTLIGVLSIALLALATALAV